VELVNDRLLQRIFAAAADTGGAGCHGHWPRRVCSVVSPQSRFYPGRDDLADLLLVAATRPRRRTTWTDMPARWRRCCDDRLEPSPEQAPRRGYGRSRDLDRQSWAAVRGKADLRTRIRPVIAASICLSRRRTARGWRAGAPRPIGLPGLSEPQIVRHFTRLSQKNYAIDSGLYPLGSCTMKHNPRLNEKLARLPGLPTSTRCSRRRRSPAR